jgi:pimeloyl-ACP methyl ester carboxylesterase
VVALFFAAALHLKPCTIAGAKARCGTFDVRESPRSNRTLALKVIVLPATEHNDSPVFAFNGGPGEPTTPFAEEAVKSFGAERRRHDLVLTDERGTPGSAPLACPKAVAAHAEQLIGGDLFPPAFVADCRREIEVEQHADLTAYTFPYFVDDIEALRRALGYDKINIIGLSYGTRAALTFLQRHPGSARSLLLLGPLPPDNPAPLNFARDAQTAFDKLAAVCAADATCRSVTPDVKADLARALAALEAKPAELDAGGYHLRITRGGFAEFLRSSMYRAEQQARLPLIIHRAALGDWKSLAPLWIRYRKFWYDNVGVFLAVTCASDVRRIDPAAIPAATAGTFVGDYRVRRQIAACQLWAPGVEPRVEVPRDSGVPILVVTGDRDPVTPKRWADALAHDVGRVRTVVQANTGHEGTECELKMETAFFDAGSFDKLDQSCAATIKNPPFATKFPKAVR